MGIYDQEAFEEYLDLYKALFKMPGCDEEKSWWECERYKWCAVKQFQSTWNIDAPDLSETLDKALSKADNLLASKNSFPKGMIVRFAKAAPDTVRAMFADLFDEQIAVIERIERFKAISEKLRIENMPEAKNHYQDESTITVYLWLRYPDKYCIYKYGEARILSQALGSELPFKKGRYVQNLTSFLDLYNELHDAISKDEDLRCLLDSCLDAECYPDPSARTLTADFGYFVSSVYQELVKAEQEDGAFDPEISVEAWKQLLRNPKVFTASAWDVMRAMLDSGGEATCTQLAAHYGRSMHYYLSNSVALAKRVHAATNCPVPVKSDGGKVWWPILYRGRSAPDGVAGSFLWMLQPELAEALEAEELQSDAGHWWLNANPEKWSFSAMPIGEVQSYTLFNEDGNKRRIYQNFLDAKPGDIVIGYESSPVKQVVAIGEIVSGSDGEKITFRKTEALTNPIDYADLKQLSELKEMEVFGSNPYGSIFKVTDAEYQTIMDVVRENNASPDSTVEDVKPYDREQFLEEVYLDGEDYDLLERTIRKKKNLILQGAPGTGKTFAAKRLAYALMGYEDDSRVGFVQFHQSYSYEDFVMGYRPDGEGFKLSTGVFYDFCKKAESRPEKDYFFIIDEINRGNISKSFGELLMLIESDHRGDKVTLAYSGMPFSVPENLYIIGMMNTADRSLAMIDYALRRRFAFYEMRPAFDSDGFRCRQKVLGSEKLDSLIEQIKSLNKEIEEDGSLGRGFRLGHSYFCDLSDACVEELQAIVDLEIVPMLQEYWFDDEARVDAWRTKLETAIR